MSGTNLTNSTFYVQVKNPNIKNNGSNAVVGYQLSKYLGPVDKPENRGFPRRGGV
jgi:hypothetical protein